MNIILPKRFYYTEKKSRNVAYIENGKLYIDGSVNYESIMYSLAYSIYGYNRCFYCGVELNATNRTLDHMFPRMWGGISIPNNLRPCCKKCNIKQKHDMTYNQYKNWLKLRSDKERAKYYEHAISSNMERLRKGKIILPKQWLTQYDITNLLRHMDLRRIKKDDQNVKMWFDQSHTYCKPIIVSSDGWMYKGAHILYHARNHGITKVPAVVLDNVIKL